jgi:predicted GNAT superfamily acetyltransferase
MTKHIIRNAKDADFPSIIELNKCFVHFTSEMDQQGVTVLDTLSCFHKVVEFEGQVVAFVLAIDAKKNYNSVNYQWFKQRYHDFIYIDRIVIGAGRQGKGLGRMLYKSLFDYAEKNHFKRIACEFDIKPPNEVSASFHRGFGFYQVGTQELKGGKKAVSLQVADI